MWKPYSFFPQQFFSMLNVLQRKYQESFENMKDQIYFMQTETPEYKTHKQAGVAASKVWKSSLIYLDDLSVGEPLVTLAFACNEKKRGLLLDKKVLWYCNMATTLFKILSYMSIHNTQLPSSIFHKGHLRPRSRNVIISGRRQKRPPQEKATGGLMWI